MDGKITNCRTGPSCKNLVGPRRQSPYCSACDSRMEYWKHKPYYVRMKRVTDLTKYQTRMENIVVHKSHKRRK